MTIDTSISDWQTIIFTNLIPYSLQVWLIPPLSYILAIELGTIALTVIWYFLSPKQENEEVYNEDGWTPLELRMIENIEEEE